jgi:hypothetical protein
MHKLLASHYGMPFTSLKPCQPEAIALIWPVNLGPPEPGTKINLFSLELTHLWYFVSNKKYTTQTVCQLKHQHCPALHWTALYPGKCLKNVHTKGAR